MGNQIQSQSLKRLVITVEEKTTYPLKQSEHVYTWRTEWGVRQIEREREEEETLNI